MMREPTSDSRNWTDRWVIIKLRKENRVPSIIPGPVLSMDCI